jgi:thioesterase domain-containing protein
MNLASTINASFKANLPLSTVFHTPTIATLAELLESQSALPAWYSIIPNQRRGSRPPLFCIEVIGADFFKFVGADQPVYSLRFGVGAPHGTVLRLPMIEDLAAHYIQQLQMVQPKGPYFLVGYSYGGLVAYEIALQLTARGEVVEFVTMVDTAYTPTWNPRRQTPADRLTSSKLFEKLKYKLRTRFTIQHSRFRLQKLIHGSTYYRPDSFDLETIHTLMRAYKPRPYSGKVFFFRATESSEGWKRLVGKGFEVEEISTDHAGLMRGEDVASIVHKIRTAMDRAIARDQSTEKKPRERPGHGDGADSRRLA